MKKTEQTIGMIRYRPTILESMKISYIAEVFGLNNCNVLRELMTGHWTLDELHAIAHKTSPEYYGFTLPYLKKAFDPVKSIDAIVKDGVDLGDFEQLSENDQFNDVRDDYYDDIIDKYYSTSLRNEKQYTIFDESNGDS
jgi:hypothetical protein